MASVLVHTSTTQRKAKAPAPKPPIEVEPGDDLPMPMVSARKVRAASPWSSRTPAHFGAVTVRFDHSRLAARLRAAVAASQAVRCA